MTKQFQTPIQFQRYMFVVVFVIKTVSIIKDYPIADVEGLL